MVYTIGEIVLDIIFKTFNNIRAIPGGAMLNTAVSLGRLDIATSHISLLSEDKISELVSLFLQENNVKSEFVITDARIKTTLALAFLNKNNDAEYSFYKSEVEKVLLSFPNIKTGDVILYGSYFSIDKKFHLQIKHFLKNKTKLAIKIYDPNFRNSHLSHLQRLKPMILENIKNADIIKGSDEDFINIFNIKSGKEVWRLMKRYGVKVLFYTKGEQGSEFYSDNIFFQKNTNKINTTSTIGAGDTYTAGIIYFFNKIKVNVNDINLITKEQWYECIEIAHNFAGKVCQGYDNYLPIEYCNTIKRI